MSAITTHVLDTARGRPASGMEVLLERRGAQGGWDAIGRGVTGADGRVGTLMPESESAPPGIYQLIFATGPYFEAQGLSSFYPHVVVTFAVPDGEAHHHVPLLVSPFGFTTYRGS